jgi:phage tail protein X
LALLDSLEEILSDGILEIQDQNASRLGVSQSFASAEHDASARLDASYGLGGGSTSFAAGRESLRLHPTVVSTLAALLPERPALRARFSAAGGVETLALSGQLTACLPASPNPAERAANALQWRNLLVALEAMLPEIGRSDAGLCHQVYSASELCRKRIVLDVCRALAAWGPVVLSGDGEAFPDVADMAVASEIVDAGNTILAEAYRWTASARFRAALVGRAFPENVAEARHNEANEHPTQRGAASAQWLHDSAAGPSNMQEDRPVCALVPLSLSYFCRILS